MENKDNCLFCLTDDMCYGQIVKSEAENTIKYLNETQPDKNWRMDEHPYSFVASPTLNKVGGTKYNNPCRLMDGCVWITCVNEYCTCITDGIMVTFHSRLYNFFKSETE